MTTEELKNLGLNEDQIKQVFALKGKELEQLKQEAEQYKAERDAVKAQLGDANAKIEEFGKLNVDEIRKAAEEWKNQAEQAKQEAQEQINGLKLNYALQAAIGKAKPKNADVVMKLLNRDDIKLDKDGNVIGLNEQIDKIKAENDYLFDAEEEKKAPAFSAKSESPESVGELDAARAIMGLAPEKE